MERSANAFKVSFPFLAGSVCIVLAAIVLEGIFLSSNSSDFAELGALNQFLILANSFFLALIPLALLWLVLFCLAYFFFEYPRIINVLLQAPLFAMSFLFLILCYSHLETFIYIKSGWETYALSRANNIIILFIFINLGVILTMTKGRTVADVLIKHRLLLTRVMLALAAVCFVSALYSAHVFLREARERESEIVVNNDIGDKPNIILFFSDSLDCRRMGVYGYTRETTPHLSTLQNCVIYNRVYCNSGNSRGSIASILTGKSPEKTRLFSPYGRLRKSDAFQHLPNILARLGYYNIDLNDSFVTSTSLANLREGFHNENGFETNMSIGVSQVRRIYLAFSEEKYFLSKLLTRHFNKVAYMITHSQRLVDEVKFFKVLNEGSLPMLSDKTLVDILIQTIRDVDKPLFARIHLMGTHGPVFRLSRKKFSDGGYVPEKEGEDAILEKQRRQYYSECTTFPADRIAYWNQYDDAILLVDQYFGMVLEVLRETGKIDNTVILFLTDHGVRSYHSSFYRIKYPLPLIVHLPGQDSGRIEVREPVQYLDIAPSILAFLAQPIPEWMEGSIIFGNPMENLEIPDHLIIAFAAKSVGVITKSSYYYYNRKTHKERLYDISEDPFVFRKIKNQELVQKSANVLAERLNKSRAKTR